MSDSEQQPLLGGRENRRLDRTPLVSSAFPRQISNIRRPNSSLLQNTSRDVLPQDLHTIQNANFTSPPSNWKLRLAVFTILSSVVFERISFYGFTGNLVLFLNMSPFLWESYHAMNAMFLFFGITYIMSLIGGWIADSCMGRFKFMLLAFIIYLAGYVLLPFVSANSDASVNSESLPKVCLDGENEAASDRDINNPFEENCAWLIYVTLIIIGIGAGGLKSSICPFGSEQLFRSCQQTQLSFFNWFYWCVNFGSFVGLGGLAFIEQQVQFQLGFIVGAVTLGISGVIFVMGRCVYVSRLPDGSVLTNIYRIIKEAWKRRKQRKQLQHLYEQSASEGSHGYIESTHEERIGFLDNAKHRYGGSFHNSLVDDVKKLGMVLLVFAVLIPYWIVYFQMQTSFLFQGLHMKLGSANATEVTCPATEINNTQGSTPYPEVSTTYPPQDLSISPKIVAAWFTLFDACFVIILLPLFDRVIYPRMAKAGYTFTFTKRIVLGMFFAMSAMIVAAIVEHFRLKSFFPDDNCQCVNASIKQIIGNTTYEAADMSVFWQIPQYALIGISEVFASVASLQFAVTVAPKSMKAIITGLYYFFSGVGSLLGTAILSILSSTQTWFNSKDYGNINCRLPCNDSLKNDYQYGCHLDYYFYLLAGIELLAIILFLVVANKFGLNVDHMVMVPRSREETAAKKDGRREDTQ